MTARTSRSGFFRIRNILLAVETWAVVRRLTVQLHREWFEPSEAVPVVVSRFNFGARLMQGGAALLARERGTDDVHATTFSNQQEHSAQVERERSQARI
jgi:hypothetical protein